MPNVIHNRFTRWCGSWVATKDVVLMRFFNSKLRCRVLDTLTPWVTHLGSAGATIASIVAVYTCGHITKKPQLIQLAYAMLVSSGFSHGLVHILKRKVNRPRPELRLTDIRVFRVPICRYSFPSGHTAAAFAVGLPFAWALSGGAAGELYSRIIMGWAYLIGFSRVYLGVHYPSDVLVGGFLGVGGAMVARSLLSL